MVLVRVMMSVPAKQPVQLVAQPASLRVLIMLAVLVLPVLVPALSVLALAILIMLVLIMLVLIVLMLTMLVLVVLVLSMLILVVLVLVLALTILMLALIVLPVLVVLILTMLVLPLAVLTVLILAVRPVLVGAALCKHGGSCTGKHGAEAADDDGFSESDLHVLFPFSSLTKGLTARNRECSPASYGAVNCFSASSACAAYINAGPPPIEIATPMVS